MSHQKRNILTSEMVRMIKSRYTNLTNVQIKKLTQKISKNKNIGETFLKEGKTSEEFIKVS